MILNGRRIAIFTLWSICGSGIRYGSMDIDGIGEGFFFCFMSGMEPELATTNNSPRTIANVISTIKSFLFVAHPL